MNSISRLLSFSTVVLILLTPWISQLAQAQSNACQFHVSTLAGNGKLGFQDGAAKDARFYYPRGLAVDKQGNVLVADTLNHRIRKISVNGQISTLAGTGQKGFRDGPALRAHFNRPTGLALDNAGNLYIADTFNHRIRKLTPDGDVITVVGDGAVSFSPGQTDIHTTLFTPEGVAVDAKQRLFITDGRARIMKWEQNELSVMQHLGLYPIGITLSHNALWVGGSSASRIYQMPLDGGSQVIAGQPKYTVGASGLVNGPARQALFNMPVSVYAASSQRVFVADRGNHQIRLVIPNKEVMSCAGSQTSGFVDGSAANARFNGPYNIAGDAKGRLYVADSNNHAIRVLTPISGS